MTQEPTVFVVDDDPDIRASLNRLLQSVNLPVELFDSAGRFLESGKAHAPGCLLLDVRMPGMDGLELLDHLKTMRLHPPVILLSGHGDIPMVLRAMRAGALDFIEKPANHQRLIETVRHALEIDQAQRIREDQRNHFQTALAALSTREREVMEQMVAGANNKAMAQDLGISERTLEKHRKNVLEKMGMRSLAVLIRAVVSQESNKEDEAP
ncbi:MAG: response regulator transcription factor [Methylococcus sp.]